MKFLFEAWKKIDVAVLNGVSIVMTHGQECHSLSPLGGTLHVQEVPQLSNCTHEEADTRMFLHAIFVANTCDSNIVIRSPDTDVLVIGIALESDIASSRLYFHTGRDENVRTIDLHAIRQHLGDDITNALIGLHCFTGCDSVSAIYGKGKAKPLKLVRQNPTFCSAFQALGESFIVSEEMVTALEAFVCALYGQKGCLQVNEARYVLFSSASREENSMPPNRDSLFKHVQRANFQAAIYKRSLAQRPSIPSPVGQGWKMEDNALRIDWMDMQAAQQSILELTSCSCKKSKCRADKADNNCCVSFGLLCTELCTCSNIGK